MTRGGARPGAGKKLRGDVRMSEMLRAPCAPAMLEWAEHVASHAGMPVAEWLRMLADKAISEHRCDECADEATSATSSRCR